MAARRSESSDGAGDSSSAMRDEMASSDASATQDSSRRWMPAAAAGVKERSSLPHSLKGSEQEESPLSL